MKVVIYHEFQDPINIETVPDPTPAIKVGVTFFRSDWQEQYWKY